MKFYADPDLLIRVIPRRTRPKNLKVIQFDKNGEYETDNPAVIEMLKPHFKCDEAEPKQTTQPNTGEETKLKKCKKCDFETDNNGALMAHYRKEHPKEKER
jgi:hypothetical protein